MQVWALHNKCRYVYVATEGPVILFDYGCARHLSEGYELIDETRTAFPHTYFTNGGRHGEYIDGLAKEDRRPGAPARRRQQAPRGRQAGPASATHALEREGVTITDGEELMEWARAIKNADEILAMKEAIAACEAGIEAMWRALKPGMTENELWAHLHATNIAKGGEWIECRLLTSGERTNPWFQECSDRVIQKGDIVGFDTDLIGPNGYCADISRSLGRRRRRKPTDEQRRLYGVALDNLHHNLDLVKAGLSFREFAEKSFKLPGGIRGPALLLHHARRRPVRRISVRSLSAGLATLGLRRPVRSRHDGLHRSADRRGRRQGMRQARAAGAGDGDRL